jgi:allantoinase
MMLPPTEHRYNPAPRLELPDGARLAVWIVLNVESFEYDSLYGVTIATPPAAPPDVANFSWRDYGNRVGLTRLLDITERFGITGSVALNSLVCTTHPELVQACADRGWEFMGHGRTNSSPLAGTDDAEQAEVIRSTLDAIEASTGQRPVGWLGPALAETESTLDLLAAEQIRYVADWVNDDRPYTLRTPTSSIVSMPYSLEVNDLVAFHRRGFSGPQFAELLRDQFDVLHEESATAPKVMCVALHPYVAGVPYRAKHLQLALEYFRRHDDVCFTTGAELLERYETAVSYVQNSAAPAFPE